METPSAGKPSYIDGVLSTQFNECNIASADACKLAHELYRGKAQSERLSVIDEVNSTGSQELETVTLGTITLGSPLTHEEKTVIQLEMGSRNRTEKNRPRLLAVFNDDIAIPIASFEKRTDGRCSYVQLGQEMLDDNIVATTKEPRAEYVEAIRALLEKRLTPESSLLITELVNQEIAAHATEAALQLSPALCRLVEAAYRHMNETTQAQMALLHDGSIDSEHTEMEIMPLKPDYLVPMHELSERRPVNYYLAKTIAERSRFGFKSRQVTDTIRLLAVTRQSVGLEIANFQNGLTSVNEGPTQQPAHTAQLVALRGLIATCVDMKLTKNKPNVKFLQKEYEEEDEDRKSQMTFSRWIEHRMNYSKTAGLEWEAKRYRFFQALIATHHSRVDNQLKVNHRLSNKLGEYNRPTDELLQKLSDIAVAAGGDANLRGVLEDRKVGKTVSDVDIVAHITSPAPSQLQAHISGRPSSQPELDPVTIFLENLSLTSPNSLPTDKVTEMTEIIDTLIKPKTPKKK